MRFKSLSKILTVLSLTICFCSASLAGTWFDDFERSDFEVWEIYNLNRNVEEWSIKNGEAIGKIAKVGFITLLITGAPDWSDYSVECRAKCVEAFEFRDAFGVAPAEFGLSVYDDRDENSCYMSYIDLTRNEVLIAKCFDDKWTLKTFPFVSQKDTWYKLRVSVKEQEVEFVINDEKQFIAKYEGEKIESGRIALIVGNGEVHFDNVAIRGPKIPSTGPGQLGVEAQRSLTSVWGKIKLRS